MAVPKFTTYLWFIMFIGYDCAKLSPCRSHNIPILPSGCGTAYYGTSPFGKQRYIIHKRAIYPVRHKDMVIPMNIPYSNWDSPKAGVSQKLQDSLLFDKDNGFWFRLV